MNTLHPATGVIGLGAMGSGVARSLLRAGFATHVCDARAAAVESFTADGAAGCANPAEPGRTVRRGDQRGGRCRAD